MEKVKKKRRYSFGRVLLWVTLINGMLVGMVLIILFYVKFPGQTEAMKVFNVPHYIWKSILGILFQAVFDYFALNWFYRLLARRATWKQYLLPVGCLIGCCYLYYMINDLVSQKEELEKLRQMKMSLDISLKIFSYSLAGLFQVFVPLLIAAVTWQLDERRRQAADQKTLEQRAFRLEKEKMQADYLFLKAQINPHFLHNTLNFFYARSLPYSAELSEGILTLSEIMRYSLDKTEDVDGKVPLTKELEHVRNIIKIQQLRFGNILQVLFIVRGRPEGRRILPFVLITLVENAFKHGDLKDADHPVRLELELSEDGRLHFFCSNRKKTGPKELSTGIGLDNTRKRLELAYGENYSLYIKDQRDLFNVDLTVIL